MLKKAKLARKLYALITVMTVIMLLGTAGAYFGMDQILKKYGNLVKREGAKQEAAKEAVVQLGAATRAVREFVIRGDAKSAETFRDALSSMLDELMVYERLPMNSEESETLTAVKATVAEYTRAGEEVLKNRSGGAASLEKIRKSEDEARENVEKLTGVTILNHDAVRLNLISLVGTLKAVHVSASLVGIAIGWILSYLLIRKLDDSIRAVKEVAEEASKGDLTRDVPIKSDDEVGEMASRFNKMMEDLRHITAQIRGMTAALASSSTQVSATTDSLSQGAREQARQAEQAAAAITEMSQTVMDVAKNASEASGASRDASQVAVQGKERVENTVAGMHVISGTVKESAAIIDDLGRSSREIGAIVSTINDIADQTNLLALNAAIEAARAGDYGRGFAVVADEVRKLAERTAVATQEITMMIGKVQSGAERSVTSMRDGIAEVERGVTLAEQAREALERIVNSSTRSTDMIQRIAAATEEQSAASEQVSANMESIAQTARTTETSLDQIRASILDLSKLATDLDKSASWFRI